MVKRIGQICRLCLLFGVFCFSSLTQGDDVQLLLKKGEQAILAEDHKKALQHYTQAAQLGEVSAQVTVALMLLKGEIVKQDLSQALHWFFVAANSGSVEGMYNLGSMHKQGKGTRTNYLKAAQWFKRAAELGNVQAQFELAQMYKKGLGVSKRDDRAAYWFEKAALQHHPGAQASLGIAFITAEGISQDYEKAVYWLTQATRQGHKAAKNNLGFLYEHGYGVNRNYQKALKLYSEVDSQWSKKRSEIVQKKLLCLNDASTLLFRIAIKCANRDALSKAIKAGGALPIAEDSGSWGDSYLTRSSEFGSSELYVAYTLDNRFAIAQYTFADAMDMVRMRKILDVISSTYGKPNSEQPNEKHAGSLKYKWLLDDGISLSLTRDWPDKIVELTYTFEENFNAMVKEQDKQDSINGTEAQLDSKIQF